MVHFLVQLIETIQRILFFCGQVIKKGCSGSFNLIHFKWKNRKSKGENNNFRPLICLPPFCDWMWREEVFSVANLKPALVFSPHCHYSCCETAAYLDFFCQASLNNGAAFLFGDIYFFSTISESILLKFPVA